MALAEGHRLRGVLTRALLVTAGRFQDRAHHVRIGGMDALFGIACECDRFRGVSERQRPVPGAVPEVGAQDERLAEHRQAARAPTVGDDVVEQRSDPSIVA